MELPGSSLQKACRLLVVFCALHLSAVLFYYLRGNTVGQGWSPEPPPRIQTFARRESGTLYPGNISKPVEDCPDQHSSSLSDWLRHPSISSGGERDERIPSLNDRILQSKEVPELKRSQQKAFYDIFFKQKD